MSRLSLKSSRVVFVALSISAMMLFTACGKEETSYIANGMEAMQALNYQEAKEDFDQAIENGEDARLALRGRGMVSLAQLKCDEAIADFTEALRLSNGVPTDLDYDLNYYLASAYYKSGQLDQAKAVYDAILALRSDEINAYYLRGVVTLEQGNYDAAYEDFHKAMDLCSDDYDMVLDIYQVLAAWGYKESGREMISTVIASGSTISDYDMGRFEYYLGNYDSAKSYLEQAKDGDMAQNTLFLGRTYEALGDYNYAISLYNTYLDKDHNDPQIYNQMGLCQMKMERYAEALGSFQAGMNLEDNSILQTLKFNEIVAYEYMEEYQTASTLMGDYLKTYPDDSSAAREYIFLKTR